MLDLDHFKSVNDRLGHGVGDQVLQTVARAISRTLRETDLAARWGGEEFLLILPSTSLESAVACAERVRNLVADLPLATGDRVTVSGGVAQLRHGEDLADVVARADQALYEAKAAGRNQIR
jgi:diguanylate cyclase (GGDEF)-like protein